MIPQGFREINEYFYIIRSSQSDTYTCIYIDALVFTQDVA